MVKCQSAPLSAFEIRPYAASDTSAVLDIWLAANRHGEPALSDSYLLRERMQVRDIYLPAAKITVATNAGRIAGFSALLGHQLGGLFIAPGDQRQGLGQRLLDDAIAKAGDLEVDVFADNSAARSLYERNGFELACDYIHTATHLKVLRLTRLA